jgi:hypothetical protein
VCVVVFFLFQKNFSPGEEIVKTSNVVSPLMDVPASFFSFLYTSACVLHWYYIPAAIGLSPSQRNRCIIYPHVCVIASISRVSLFFSLETRAVCIPFLYLQACLYGIPTPAKLTWKKTTRAATLSRWHLSLLFFMGHAVCASFLGEKCLDAFPDIMTNVVKCS